jgi:Flp pilus assembly protein TadD
LRALSLDPGDEAALAGFVRTATLTDRSADALTALRALIDAVPSHAEPDGSYGDARPSARHDAHAPLTSVPVLIALSQLQAKSGSVEDAVATARQASRLRPADPAPLEQLALLFADTANTVQLDVTNTALQALAPERAATHYFAAVAAFLHGNAAEAVRLAERAVLADANYAPTYDLIGAAYTKLEQPDAARQAFQRSLALDAHDSTAYANLGLLELASGRRAAARNYFAEALWLAPDSPVARAGLARTQ